MTWTVLLISIISKSFKKSLHQEGRILVKLPNKELLNLAKVFIKRIPGIQELNGIRHKIMRIQELSTLIKENRIVVFPSYSEIGKDAELIQKMAQEIMKEWLDLYGIAYLGKSTVATTESSRESILLFAPQAVLRIPTSHEDYLMQVERETRRLIRLAERHAYEVKEFNWNDHLDEIYEINKSKEVRQSEPMRGWYRDPVQPRKHSREELQYLKYFGVFKDEKLYAYFHYWICGDFVFGKHIIGHARHLKYGIMNALISRAVQECIANSQTQWLQYGVWSKGSLGAFKQHAGFQSYAILLDLKDNQELLEYSKHKVRTIWRL